jgi:glutamate-1-semialdehyde 2,1-aminomutase
MKMNLSRSRALHERASRTLAGGVSTMVRADSLPTPIYIDSASGVRMRDVDGNEYLDYAMAFGPLILGHSHPEIVNAVTAQVARGQTYGAQHELELIVAELIHDAVPCAEMVTFAMTGTEATQLATRLARAATSRPLIVKFEGHYHGWSDSLLYSFTTPVDELGPRDASRTIAGSRGQAPGGDLAVITLPWNDLAQVQRLLSKRGNEIAAIITEPVMFNAGGVMPVPGFLEGLRRVCDEYGIILIFDEVITGFRIAYGGAQQVFHVVPDLAVFGKAIAGGFPFACVAGKQSILSAISRREVVQAGTLNGNPVALAACRATLECLKANETATYQRMSTLGDRLRDGLLELLSGAGIKASASGLGPAFAVSIGLEVAPVEYRDLVGVDRATQSAFAVALLDEGVFTIQRGMWYLSAVHASNDIDDTLEATKKALAHLS